MSVDTKSLGKKVNELLVLATLRDGPKHGYQIALDVEEGRRRKEYRLTRSGRKPLGEGAGALERLFETLLEILEDPGHDALRTSPATG